MRLTAFTDYSLRVLMYLAASQGRRATVAEVCAAFDIKPNHVTKVVHHLARRGWVTTTRGKGGGLALALPAAQIRIGDVVRDTEGQAQPAECFSANASGRCAIVGPCRLRGVLAEAVAAFHAALDRHTLDDITAHPQELARLLRIRLPDEVAA